MKATAAVWKPHRLDDLGFVGRGRSRHRPRNDPSLYGGSFPFVQTGDIKAANLRLREFTQTYNDTGLAQSKLWDPGTLCITIAANIAETAILDIPACFPDSVIGFLADPRKAEVLFVKYYIDFIKLRMQQVSHGTTQDNLSLDKLLRFDFIVPDVDLQQRIASILSTYDDLIENNLRRIKILEEMAQALYREWFVNFRFPGHEKVRMVESSLGEIPEGWEVRQLRDLCSWMQSGGTPSRKEPAFWDPAEIAWYKTKELQDSFLFDSEEKISGTGLDGSSAKIFPPGTILMAIYGSPTVGRLGILTEPSSCNQAALGMIAAEEHISQEFLYYALMSLRDHFNSISQGAAQQNISKEKVADTDCLVPDRSIRLQFDKNIRPMWQLLENTQRRNAILRRTRDLLLPKLISGDLDVSNLDIPIPEEAA